MSFAILPGVRLDDVALEATVGLALINRIPGPDDIFADADGDIIIEIASATGSPPSSSATVVEIDGAAALAGGVFSPAWDGARSTWSYPDALTLRIVIDGIDDLTSLATVTVRVVSQDAAATTALDETYSFVVEDLIPPGLVSAASAGRDVVVVEFDEPMDWAGDAGAPASWRLEAIDTPAVAPAVIAVTPTSASTAMLALDATLSFGRRMRIVVEGAADVWGNVLERGDAEFVSAVCRDAPGNRAQLVDFIPAAVRAADTGGDQAAFLAVWQDLFDQILCDADELPRRVVDPETAEEKFLDRMLADLGSPFAFEDLGERDKRRLVHALPTIYGLKGTEPGMTAAIRFFIGLDVEIDVYNADVWEMGIDELGVDTFSGADVLDQRLAYSFRIIAGVPLTSSQRTRVAALAMYMKGIHEHFLGIVEPDITDADHWELGLSLLGVETELHE